MNGENADHLTPEDIAAYLNQAVSTSERRSIEQHLVQCEACRKDLVDGTEVDPRRRAIPWVAWGVPAAAAAVLAIMILGPTERAGVDRTDVPLLRREQVEGTARFDAVSPADGARLARDTLVFRWRSEGVEVHYLLTLTDESGDVVWSGQTSDTTLTLPRDVAVTPGRSYFWYVDALLEGARSSTTGVLEFVARP
jgi:hypothetical protein